MLIFVCSVQVTFDSGRLSCCGLSGESGSLVIMDCGDLVSDLRHRIESGEEIQSIFADFEYGVEAELEEFARRLLILLTNTLEEPMIATSHNGLSTSPQQAKILSIAPLVLRRSPERRRVARDRQRAVGKSLS